MTSEGVQNVESSMKYSQMKLQLKREALQKLDRKANEGGPGFDAERAN